MFDSHVHLDYPKFYEDLDEVARRMLNAGVTGAMNPAVDLDSSALTAEISRRHDWVMPAIGIHPLYIGRYGRPPVEELSALASAGNYRAVGEVGLDFWNGREDEGEQREFFEAQVALAKTLGLPLLLHVRKAFYEVAGHLQAARFGNGGVFHAFSGSWEMAKKALDMGFHLSICANITRPTKSGLTEVVRRIPRERLLVETDAPDMPPHFKKGETHYPWELGYTVQALAGALGAAPAEVAEFTAQNAVALFGRNGCSTREPEY